MNVRRVSFVSLSACFFLMATAPAQNGVPSGLAAFVERTAADIGASPLNIPQFKSAKVDGIEDLHKANGIDRYLCWLKADPNRVGYIAVASDGKSFQVLAFSATGLSSGYFGYDKCSQVLASCPAIAKSSQVLASCPAVSSPAYFLEHLDSAQPSTKSLDFSRIEHLSFVEHVPLVPAARTFWGTQPLEMSETAASLSSLFNYLQNQKEILFFGHSRDGSTPEYGQRILEDYAAGRLRQDPGRQSLEEKCRKVMNRENIPQGQTAGEKADYKVRIRNVIKPIIRQRLLDPNNAYERLEALRAEQTAVGGVTIIDISQGMKDAVFFEMDYLEDNPTSIKQNLALFLKTRGRTANTSIVPFAELPGDSLPSVLIGPDNIAAVVLGRMDIDGERFSLVFFPKTGRPNRVSLADKIRALAGADRLADPNRGRNAEERESLARMRRTQETMIVVEDPESKLPDSVSAGVHVCRTSSLAQWQAIDIGKIDLADNWGSSEQ